MLTTSGYKEVKHFVIYKTFYRNWTLYKKALTKKFERKKYFFSLELWIFVFVYNLFLWNKIFCWKKVLWKRKSKLTSWFLRQSKVVWFQDEMMLHILRYIFHEEVVQEVGSGSTVCVWQHSVRSAVPWRWLISLPWG